mgnify:CR=1 FL=1
MRIWSSLIGLGLMFAAPASAWAQPSESVARLRPLSESASLPALDFSIDGKGPFTAIVDTGNGTIGFAISRSLATTLSLPDAPGAVTDSPAGGVGGGARPDLSFVRARSVVIAGREQKNVTISVTAAFDRLSTVIGAPIQGNLGYAWLKDCRVTIDWPGRSMRLSAFDPVLPGSTAMTVAPGKPLIVTDVRINGAGPFPAVFDTGAGLNLIAPALARDLGLTPGDAVEIHGVSGQSRGRGVTLGRLQLGGSEVKAIDAVVASAVEQVEALAGTKVMAVFGRALLERAVLIIDYPARRIAFRRAP